MGIYYLKLVNNVLLAAITLFIGFKAEVSASQTGLSQVLVAQSQVQNISAVLPASTEVTLKSGGSKFGKLIALDPNGRKLTLALQNGKSELIPIAQVETIRFWTINPVTRERLGRPQGDTKNWSNIPLANVRIQANGNRAEIRLPCGVDSDVCKRPIASYTVTDLSFDGNKVTLIVIVAR